MLGTDSVAARAYLRRVQQLAGPVPFDVIVEAMRHVPGFEVDRVAVLVAADQALPLPIVPALPLPIVPALPPPTVRTPTLPTVRTRRSRMTTRRVPRT